MPAVTQADGDLPIALTKALRGEIENFTGISDPYEEPETPEITVHTGNESIEESAKRILAFLEQRELL